MVTFTDENETSSFVQRRVCLVDKVNETLNVLDHINYRMRVSTLIQQLQALFFKKQKWKKKKKKSVPTCYNCSKMLGAQKKKITILMSSCCCVTLWCGLFYLSFLSLNIHKSKNRRVRGWTILPPLYHFYQFHEYLEIRRTIIAESSPLHISNVWARTWNLWFPIVSR